MLEPDDNRDAVALIRAAGLMLSGEEETQVSALYQRFAQARAALAAVSLGEAEPALTFSAARRPEENP